MSNDRTHSGHRRSTQSRGSQVLGGPDMVFGTFEAQPTEGPTWTSFDKRPIQRMESGAQPAAATVDSPTSAPKPENKTGIPDKMKANLEAMSGFSADDIRVHRGSSKPKEVGAHSYAQGSNVYLGPGREKDLGHELWHTVQQKQGRVDTKPPVKGQAPINQDSALEEEAQTMGAKLG